MTAPPSPRMTTWGVGAASYAALIAVVLVMVARSNGRTPDDAFIFFRYARNIAEGHGWVYNLGESTVNGATSPLWTLVLALAYLVHDNMAANGWFLYAASLAGGALLTAASLHRLGHSIAGVCAAVLLVLNPVLLWVRGMESGLLVLLSAATVYAGLNSRRSWPLGILGGLLILTRPDATVLFGLVLAARWWQQRRLPWIEGVVALAVVSPWIAFSIIEWGTPVAGTLSAKSAQGESGYWGPPFVFARHLRTMVNQPWSLVMMILAIPGVVTGLRSRTTRIYLEIVLGSAAIHFLAYTLVIRPPAYPWYYAPVYWSLAIVAALGIGWLAATGADLVTRRGVQITPRALTICLAAVLLAVTATLEVRGQRRDDVYVGYEQAGHWLRENTPPDASVAATEIGVLGWLSERHIVDYLGLLSEQSTEEVRQGDLSSWIDREEPDFYVQHVPLWDMEAPSKSVEWFSRAYRPVFESDVGGWSQVRIYQRVLSRDEALRSEQHFPDELNGGHRTVRRAGSTD